jgi:hypothetical protein
MDMNFFFNLKGRRKDITEYSMSDFPKNKDGSLNIKNAKALHIIRISCSRQIQNQVGFYNTARTAWLQLKYCYGGITPQAISQQGTYLNLEYCYLVRIICIRQRIFLLNNIFLKM